MKINNLFLLAYPGDGFYSAFTVADKYILNEAGEPVEATDLLQWAQWCEKGDQRVARSEVNGVMVSTIFLGLNYNFGQGEPILWETMAFKDGDECNCERCERCGGNRADALAMHEKVKALYR